MIVITGGAGFIGSNLIAGFEARGAHDIVVCDTLGTEDKWRNLARREIRDLVAPPALFDYLNQHRDEIKVVFHLGALVSTSERDADRIVTTNFALSREIWRWCAAHGVRLIYASSYATYGDGSQGFEDDESPEALARFVPLNPYGWSKHIFDRRIARILQNRNEQIPPQWAGLKFFNVYGPNEYHRGDQMSVVGKLYPQVAAGASARLFKSYHPDYKDGGQIRDFVHVDDCVSVMLWMYDNPVVCGLFNVGTGKGSSFNDLAAAVFKAAGKPARISYVDMPEALRYKYHYYTQADISKLRGCGYDQPFLDLEEGVRRYVQDFLAKDDPYL
ncbi:MAG: ADP-glyceromanno-heptose 6-epimerase [Rhodospirillales bacterium]|nr:ADP-glyceromanno-heptose 6-epimerase [Rhodospirillales bacterium]